MAYRIDRGNLAKPVKMSNGWLRIDGRLTRTGVFTYRNDDGTMRRELRLPEEVFKLDAMQSFALVPVTDEHPPGFLDAKNTREYARGSVAGTLRKDGEFIAGELLVTDADLIKKLEDGVARELSCGYNCDLDEKPGVTADGLRYDAIQRNIRGNHVAVVAKGRAGPEARVRMDGASVEVLDGDDDQPRDEEGQFASTGGASLRSPGEAKKALKEAEKKLKTIPSTLASKWEAQNAVVQKLRAEQASSSKPELKSPAKPAAAGKHVELAKTFREKLMVDASAGGFAQGSTSEIAKAFGVTPKEALSLLQKAAREGLVTRRGHEGTVKSGKKESATSGFGFQVWELSNAQKLP